MIKVTNYQEFHPFDIISHNPVVSVANGRRLALRMAAGKNTTSELEHICPFSDADRFHATS